MSTSTTKPSIKPEKGKKEAVPTANPTENVIVQKTFRMAETLKKYPPPAK